MFGLLIDQWRWNVYAGKVAPADYNTAWWDLRLKYQGVQPPAARGAAGERLDAMLKMGQSRPWPEALAGTRQMDATAMLDYFAPLKAWLEEQTKGQPTGW